MKIVLVFAYVIVSISAEVTTPAAVSSSTHSSVEVALTTPATPTTTPTIRSSQPTTGITPSAQICITNYGQCVADDKSCTSDYSKVAGICTNNEICCIPSQGVVKSWAEKDEKCEKIYGTCQLESAPCSGVWGEA
uniref:Uncharacterized protein n=1 Tax=Ciona savignyi TaxID=51511 RepID=H2YC53_CIOSA